MISKPIGICVNEKVFRHSGNWNKAFIEYCKSQCIPYKEVDCYRPDIVDELNKYSALLWPIQNYVLADIIESRNILRVAELKGLSVFPDTNTSWHFDDKIAQMYALQCICAPIPHSWVFYVLDECLGWLNTKASYPIVAKLRNGSGSNNVRILRTRDDATKYARRMFSIGFDPSPSLLYKAFSKVQSTRNFSTLVTRARRIPEFFATRKHARQLPREKGYCYFQEFVQNDGYDIKIVVVGDKLSYLARKVRKGDFRASGSGDLYYDNSLVTEQIIDSAFEVSDRLKLQCVGFDYIVNKNNNKGFIMEMCYGFDWLAVEKCGGYWDRKKVWHNTPLRIPDEIVAAIYERLLKNGQS